MSYLMNTALRHLYGNIRRSSMGITKNCDKCMNATSFHLIRSINTSEKKKDATQSITSYVPGLMDKPPKGPQTVKEFADVGEQKVFDCWVYGESCLYWCAELDKLWFRHRKHAWGSIRNEFGLFLHGHSCDGHLHVDTCLLSWLQVCLHSFIA